jgi:hypothetical protein
MKARTRMNMPDISVAQFAPIKNTSQACMNCVFWYRCRHGKIECELRP